MRDLLDLELYPIDKPRSAEYFQLVESCRSDMRATGMFEFNTRHRVTTVRSNRHRVVTVYSYYEQPDVMFSHSERLGFYGRVS